MALYRTWGMLGSLIGINIVARLLNFQMENFVLLNHIGESILFLGILALLFDLKVLKINGRTGKNLKGYLKIGILALIFGIFWEVMSFSALFFGSTSALIVSEWLRVAPIVIFLVGLPVLWISDMVSRERLIYGMNSIGWKGLVFNFVFCMGYTIIAMFLLIKYGLVVI